MADVTSTSDVSYPNPNGGSKFTFFLPPRSENSRSVTQTDIPPYCLGTGGAVIDNIKSEVSRTGEELQNLKNSKVTPSTTTATGQPLTHYHSLLYSLLSWEQPRATAISFASVVSFIFAAHYLPLLRWTFKFIYVALGFTAAAEIGGRLILSQGLTKSFRPRRYYTIPKETIEPLLEDLEQLIDFVLLEFQRVLFAENVVQTVAAFFAAFSAYWLIKFLPFWVFSLITVTIAYLGPLVYVSNREVIDAQIENVHGIISSQANQLKDLAGEHTSHATGLVKQYVDDYSTKAQEYIGQRRSASPEATKAASPVIKKESIAVPEPVIKTSDFPEAPKVEPAAESAAEPAHPVEHPVDSREPLESREPLLAA